MSEWVKFRLGSKGIGYYHVKQDGDVYREIDGDVSFSIDNSLVRVLSKDEIVKLRLKGEL